MARMRHKDVLKAIRVAGHHGDEELGMLLYVKNWVSLSVYRREFEAGAARRRSGVPCDCSVCSNPYPLDSSSPGLQSYFARPPEHSRWLQIPPGLLGRR